MSWLALEVGGANLKAANGLGFAEVRPFAVWRTPERLGAEISELLAASPKHKQLAVTMTAELADCYPTKAIGIRAILDAVESVAGQRRILVYLTNGRLVSTDAARELPQLAAASNWHALAAFANRYIAEWPALLMDMGSTTTDIIPLASSGPCPAGSTDTDRLMSGELVYTGMERTPISALVRSLPWLGGECRVASELFATTTDAYLLLGELAEDLHDTDTADGWPRTRACARARLARMICTDVDSFSEDDALLAATAVREAQLDQLEMAATHVAKCSGETPRSVILSGHGEFLLRRLLDRLGWHCEVLSLSTKLGPAVSRCAPAHALAVLARQYDEKRAST